jgi:hypothetical protein
MLIDLDVSSLVTVSVQLSDLFIARHLLTTVSASILGHVTHGHQGQIATVSILF